jgi:hypothetical protein
MRPNKDGEHMTNPVDTLDRLERLGEALDRAIRADLKTHRRLAPRRFRQPRRLAVGAALTAVLVPAAAVAATELLTTGQVAASLPQGTKALIGTNPSCTVVTADVEYRCVLTAAPSMDGAPTSADGAPEWKGTVEPTVDATKHVNGGCRAQNSTGTDWECYIGQTAVQQGIISASFLGQYAPSPGVG